MIYVKWSIRKAQSVSSGTVIGEGDSKDLKNKVSKIRNAEQMIQNYNIKDLPFGLLRSKLHTLNRIYFLIEMPKVIQGIQ